MCKGNRWHTTTGERLHENKNKKTHEKQVKIVNGEKTIVLIHHHCNNVLLENAEWCARALA